MLRRLITLTALCIFTALALASPARAQGAGGSHQESAQIATLGCNAPELVPPSEEPPQWRLLVPAFCIRRTTQLVLSPQEITAAHLKGFWWCVAWSMKPTSPAGIILTWFTAADFCSSRAWYYVRAVT